MSSSPDADFVRRTQAALMNMPKLQREIFIAHSQNAMSYAEIARGTGLTVPQVERHMARALYKLGKQLDGGTLSWWERWF